jgi:hypothetical protein
MAGDVAADVDPVSIGIRRDSPASADHDPPVDGSPPPHEPTRRRFAAHAGLLLAVLLVIGVVLVNGRPALGDEGAVLAQTHQLEQRSWTTPASWRVAHPFPELDPEGRLIPLEHSPIGDGYYLPYAKHPLYPALALPLLRLFGPTSMFLLSSVAVWIAALCAAGIAARLRPRLTLATLWIVGLGSPLLFDSTLVMAHALAAAALGALGLCLVWHLDRPRVRHVVGAAFAAAALVLLRSEGLLAVAAVSTVLGLMSLSTAPRVATNDPSVEPARTDRRSAWGQLWWGRWRVDVALAGAAVAIAVTAAVAVLLELRVAAQLLGPDEDLTMRVPTRGSFLAGRVQVLWVSILRPALNGSGWGSLVLLVGIAAVLAGAAILRDPQRRQLGLAVLCSGAGMVVLRQLAPVEVVSGLVPAFPLLVIGLMYLRRADLRDRVVQLCLGVSALTALAILATTYSVGGGVEWGGRFFHLLLPLVVPVVVLGLDRARASLPDEPVRPGLRITPRQVAVGAVLVATASLSVLSLRAVHSTRTTADQVVEAALAAADEARPAADGGAPVVISDARPFARAAWDSFTDYRMLRVPSDEPLGPVLDGLADAGVGTVVVMTSSIQQLPDDVDDRWQVAHEQGWPGLRFVELHQR